MSDLIYKTPSDLAELVSCLAAADATTYVLGGGTDFIIRMRDRGITEGTLIDITGIPGLDGIRLDGAWLRIGANATYAEIAESALVQATVPCLAEMARQIGSPQIRNMARLPGNIANASPAGDSIATLMALDASLGILNGRGASATRKVDGLVTGIGKTTLQRDEVITEVLIPRPGPHHRSAYGKIGMGARSQVVIANISMTMALDLPPGGTIRNPRIVVGSAAPTAYHATDAEALLDGRVPDPRLAGELAEVMRAQVEASIKGIALFQHKMNDVQGLALDLCAGLFGF